MEEWIDTLGPYDSKTEGRSLDAYVWDRLGINAYTGRGKDTVEGIGFYFNRSAKNPDPIEPEKLFTSGLLFNGLLLDGNFELNKANKALAQHYRDIVNDKNSDVNEVYFDSSRGKADIYYAHACIGSLLLY